MKKIFLFTAYLLLAAFIWAQDTVYWCDFDQPTDTAGWQMVNGSQPHYWVIGMDSSMTSNTLFVADIDTFANYYDGRPSVSYACRYITLARGVYHIRFDWRCVGWNGWERFVSTDRERNEIRPSSYMRVALMPGTTTLVPGMYGPEEMWFAPTSLPAGSVAIDGGTPLSEWDASGVPSGEVAPPAGWHTHEYDFVITTPGTYCLAFSWTTDNIFNVVSPPAAIDNLLITSDHCPAPSNVYVDQLRPHSFDLHWTDMSSGRATQWLANCCLASDTTCSGFPYSTNDTTISFTSLLSDRDYIVYLRPQCGADTADTVVRMRVHTPCQFIYLFPYYEDFSVVDSLNVSPFVPCWTRLGRDSTDMVCVSGKLRWRVSGDSPYPDQYLVLQGVNTSVLPINDIQLSFQGRGRLLFDVGVMSNPMDTGSFIPVATINKTLSSWELQRVEFNHYQGNGNYIAIRTRGAWIDASLDNFRISRAICWPVHTISVADVGTTSAMLTWGTYEDMRFVPDSFEVHVTSSDTSMRFVTREPRCPLSGLEPRTSYRVGVRASCNNDSVSEWRYISFSTMTLACLALDTSVVYTSVVGTDTVRMSESAHSEIFCQSIYTSEELHERGVDMALVGMDYAYPAGRTSYDISIYVKMTSLDNFDTYWSLSTPLREMVYNSVQHFVDTVDTVMHYTFDSPFMWDGISNIVVTTMVHLDSVDSTAMLFHGNSTFAGDSMSVWLWRDSLPYTYNNHGGSGSADRVQSGYRPSVTFYSIPCGNWDDCRTPVGLTVDSVETYAAYLSWLPGHEERGWWVMYRLANDSVGLVDTLYVSMDSGYAPHCRLDSLVPGQRYEVRVEPDCIGDSIFTQAEFTTLCAGIDSLPFVEDFEDFVAPFAEDGTIEYCWYRRRSNINMSTAPYVDSNFAFSGAKSLHVMSNMSSAYVYIALPPMGVRMDSLQVSFYAYGEQDYNLRVGVMTDPTDYSSFVEVAQLSPVLLHRWELMEVSLEEYTGRGRYIALAMENRQSQGMYVDDLRVDYLSACPRPRNVAVTAVTNRTATVQWFGPNALNYEIEYGPAGFVQGMGTMVFGPADSVTLTGLSGATTYDLYLRSFCAADTSTWTLVTRFSTTCENIDSLPYIQDFYNGVWAGNSLPLCWYGGAYTYFDIPSIVDRTNVFGQVVGHSLYLRSRANYYSGTYAAMPAVDTMRYPLHTLQVTIKADCGYGEYSFDGSNRYTPPYVHHLVVGVSRVPDDIVHTFTPVDTLLVTEVPTIYTVPLAAARGAGEYITFYSYRRVLESYNIILIDSVVVEPVVSCRRPYNLAASSITDTSATLTWQPNGSAIGGQVEYMPHGVALGGGTRIVVYDTTLTVTGLAPASSYDFYVRSLCTADDTSEWCYAPATFVTQQIPATVPYVYNFDSVQEWDNWHTMSNTTVNWYRGMADGRLRPPSMYVSADSGATPSTHTYEAVNAVAYRDIDFGNIDTTFVLSFNARVGGRGYSSGGLSGYYDGLAVFLADPGEMLVPSNGYYQSPWGWLYDLTLLADIRGANSWQDYSILIDSITGVHRLVFYCYSGYAEYLPFYGRPAVVDSISIDYFYDPCPVPSGVQASSVTTAAATVSWRGSADGTYRVLLFTPNNNLLASDTIVGTSHQYTNLVPGTMYKVRVSRLCPGYETRMSPDCNFMTCMCTGGVTDTIGDLRYGDISYSLPVHQLYNYSYSQQIVLASELGGAGEISSVNLLYQGSLTMTAKNRCVIYMGHTERNSFSSVADFEQPVNMQKVYDGHLNCTNGWNRIYFNQPFVYDGTSNLVIAIDDNSGVSQNNAYVYRFAASSTTDPMALVFYSNIENVNCSSNATLGAFSGTKSLLSYRTIMSFDVCPPNSCPPPALRAPRVQAGSVTLRWRQSDTAQSEYPRHYLFGYRVAGSSRWVVDNLPLDDTFYVINNFFFDTDYVYHVRQYCDDESLSHWAMGSFNTAEIPCLPPLDLRAYDITNKTARLSWTPDDNNISYRARVFNSAYDTIINTYMAGCRVRGLNAASRYYATVEVRCEYLDEPSIWSDTISFTTIRCPDATDLVAREVYGNSVLLDWQCEEDVGQWLIEWGLQGFDQGTGITDTADYHPFLLTGLTGETTYDILVRSICGDDYISEGWSDRLTVTTAYSGIHTDTLTHSHNNAFTIHPNPTSGDVLLTLPADMGAVRVEVVDISGRTMQTYTLPARTERATLATSQLPVGAYYVRLTADRLTAVRKLLKVGR